MTKTKSHLVIGDPHSEPDVPNDRFDWLGRMIVERKPDVVVCLGDFFDMGSLSSYDKGKGSMEGRRYKADLEAGEDALKRIVTPLWDYNKKMKSSKKKPYKPRMIMTSGNHDWDRISRALNQDPWQLEGIMSHADLKFIQYGWETYPYLDRVNVDGIVYTHCVQSKNAAQIMGGQNHAQHLLSKLHCSVTVGHSHLKDYKTDTTGDGRKIHALVAGCYFEHHQSYANQSNKGWWRGICYKHEVQDGNYEPEFLSIEKVKQLYS